MPVAAGHGQRRPGSAGNNPAIGPVKEAARNDRLLLLLPDGGLEINRGPEIGGHRPLVEVTMQSVAQVYGSRTTGIVLTGMGGDGALGLVAICDKGGKTFAQDSEIDRSKLCFHAKTDTIQNLKSKIAYVVSD